MKTLTHERLVELLDYDPMTGKFIRKKASRGHAVGEEAGTISLKRASCTNSYRQITVDKGRYLAHRLAWFYMTGNWPVELLDHINMDALDNRFENLREATHSTNKANRIAPANNSTGFKGVSFNKAQKKFHANIVCNYKQIHLGFFDTAQDAHDAYCRKAIELFGPFARA